TPALVWQARRASAAWWLIRASRVRATGVGKPPVSPTPGKRARKTDFFPAKAGLAVGVGVDVPTGPVFSLACSAGGKEKEMRKGCPAALLLASASLTASAAGPADAPRPRPRRHVRSWLIRPGKPLMSWFASANLWT
ncbi:MAG: hypothetical protein QGD94_09745, partial [Planctomycetia bacterium]|nr:hypothetical protein [Planctomycetia bacterium]